MTQATEQKLKSQKNKSHHVHSRPLKLWQDTSLHQEVRIEILPMIDVIFCILTFFILGAVGLSRQQAISLDLPKASTGTPQMREMLVVSLDDFGQTYLEKQLVTRNQLFDAIKNYHQFNPNGLMVLHASGNASYNEVIQVLDMLKQVGGDRVALATLPGESDSSNNAPNLTPFPSINQLPGNLPSSSPSKVPTNLDQRLRDYPDIPIKPSASEVPKSP
ncbi:ExbD/TolR family protein [Cyanobacterium sp. uoEpiScrs1]|uniref:ExbD/TolR family protein n=1 Tax=Cyanobacterium sp. uoEpiScrs1 TaxID=2976343 RepID=UPI00226A5471|nr:biopolymer transporter ExbD [Cyanobacterium sp. uoEpiScrs1]